MEPHPRPGSLQKKFFVALLIVGIVPGVAALVATYLYSTKSLEEAIGSGFQEIARSTAIRIAAAVDAEIDRAERLAIVPVHVQQVLEAALRRPERGGGPPPAGPGGGRLAGSPARRRAGPAGPHHGLPEDLGRQNRLVRAGGRGGPPGRGGRVDGPPHALPERRSALVARGLSR